MKFSAMGAAQTVQFNYLCNLQYKRLKSFLLTDEYKGLFLVQDKQTLFRSFST